MQLRAPGGRKEHVKARKGGHGATRKGPAVTQREMPSLAWLNRVLILLGIGVVLAASLKGLLVLQAIPVERIAVTGELRHTQTVAIQDMVWPALAGGFLNADLQHIREQLESLPWVYRATVKRQWPNALEIHVVEQLPIARWGEGGFLNHEGEVFRTTTERDWKSLPMLKGPEGSAPLLIDYYQRLIEGLGPLQVEVEALAVDQRGQVTATLAGEVEVMFGARNLAERLDRLETFFTTGVGGQERKPKRIDLRYNSGVAVAFKPTPEVAGL